MKYPSQLVCLVFGLTFILGCSPGPGESTPQVRDNEVGRASRELDLQTVTHTTGPFTIEIPVGWQVESGGQCATLAFVVRDPHNPLNQFFFFSNVGPVYLSQQKKQFDLQYTQSGGYPIQWLDMPVVAPLTPANFLTHWSQIINTRIARGFMRSLPGLQGFQTISEEPAANSLGLTGSPYHLVRGLFREGGRVGQGLFSLGTVPQNMAGLGFGVLVAGITAEHRDFPRLIRSLSRCLDSFHLSPDYVADCRRLMAQQFEAMLEAGRTLRETSDLITRGWEARNRSSDILSEKWSDTILGKERLYDPDRDEVLEFDLGFYDRYRLDKGTYNRPGLVPISGDSLELWSRAPLNGRAHVRQER